MESDPFLRHSNAQVLEILRAFVSNKVKCHAKTTFMT